MGCGALGKREKVAFPIDAYGGFVEVSRDQLPERSSFEWFGSGGPAEETQKRQARLQSAGLALQMDQMAIATGRPPTLNIAGLISEVLRQGGWIDIDPLIHHEGPTQPQFAAPPAIGTGRPAGAAVHEMPELIAQ